MFDLINNQVTISEEAYVLLPFKALWDRDKSKTKARALAELGHIYFMEDFRSDFSDIVDEVEREAEVNRVVSLPESYSEDEVVRVAREFYRKRSEEILPLLMLRDAKSVIDKMRAFYREVDFLETDKNGKSKYDISKVASVIEKSASILKGLADLEDMVRKEVQNKKDRVGSKLKAPFEDGIK